MLDGHLKTGMAQNATFGNMRLETEMYGCSLLVTTIMLLIYIACLRTLGFSNLDARQNDIADVHPGTCDWFFETGEFCTWRDRVDLSANNSVLWLKGKPGAGKSTLMKYIFNYCKDRFDNQLTVAYFFNARGDQLEKTCLGMLRSIVYQLIQRDSAVQSRFVQHFLDREKMYEAGKFEWRPSDLRDFVMSELGRRIARPVVLLIDALDECSESDVRSVVGFLENVSIKASHSGTTVRICLSSRHYPSISMNKKLELILENKKEHQEDIASYVREKLESKDEKLHDEIERKSNGVFLWAILVVAILNKASYAGRIEEMEQTLDTLPGDLEDVFEAMLGRDETHKAETVLMLQFVLFSVRPPTPEELFFGVMIEVAPQLGGPWDQTRIMSQSIERRIIDSSKGLIEIRKGDKSEVQFIHRSVNDFLHRSQRLCRLDPTLAPDASQASHKRLWSCCWKYIEQFDMTRTSQEDFLNARAGYPFLEYALAFVLGFANKALPSDRFIHERKARPRWLSLFYSQPRSTAADDDILQWLRQHGKWFRWWKQAMACFRPRYVDIWLEVGIEILYISALNGWKGIVRVLLDAGAEVNAQGGQYGNALQAASYQGSRETVQLLLNAGADVNAQGGEPGNALQAASLYGSQETVQLLLDAGAEVNAQGGEYGNALQAASYRRSQETVQLLLDAGAEVNAQGGEYGNALQAASCRGPQETVQLLLDAGAEVNAQGGEYGNALQAASCRGPQETVQLLLDAGADVNAQGGQYGNALQAASYRGSQETVQLLLDAGAEVNAQGGEYGNALQAASCRGPQETVQLLLDAGAEVNAQGGEYGNALQAASCRGPQETVQLLLDAGAEVNAQGGEYGNALQAASCRGPQETVQLLLDAGAEVNAQGGEYGNALQAASCRGPQETVQLLLDAGAEVNAQGGQYGNALQAASYQGSQEKVQLLLDAGAEVNAQGGQYGNALQAASLDGSQETVQLLLNAGAEVNAQGGKHGTAIQAALTESHHAIIGLLRKNGAKA